MIRLILKNVLFHCQCLQGVVLIWKINKKRQVYITYLIYSLNSDSLNWKLASSWLLLIAYYWWICWRSSNCDVCKLKVFTTTWSWVLTEYFLKLSTSFPWIMNYFLAIKRSWKIFDLWNYWTRRWFLGFSIGNTLLALVG